MVGVPDDFFNLRNIIVKFWIKLSLYKLITRLLKERIISLNVSSHLLLTFATNMDPHNVGPDLDPNCLTL